MLNRLNLPHKYLKASKNLEFINFNGGTWIDAGCGEGAYSIPLSFFVERVIAVDENVNSLNRLKKILTTSKINNITVKNFNFNNNLKTLGDNFFGILFAFSLHYQQEISHLLEESLELIKKHKGKIIIIEYERQIPVPWVPFPWNYEKVRNEIFDTGFLESELIFSNDRYFILEAKI